MQPPFANHPSTIVKLLALGAVVPFLYAASIQHQASVLSVSSGADRTVFSLFVTGAIAAYLLPSFIAIPKRNAAAIFALNLLLGWTLLGWVVALVWARKDPFAWQEGLARLAEHTGPGDVRPAGTAQPERLG